MLNTIAKPFGWLLMWLYDAFGNYGIAVILFALIVKLILLPFMAKSKHSMMRTSRLQPMMKELEKKHGANKQKYNEEVQKLYKEQGVSPMSGCIWTLIPFPILIALYQAIRYPLTIMMGVPKELIDEGGAIAQKLTELGFTTTTGNAYIQIAQSQFITDHYDQFVGLSDKLRAIDYSFLGLDLGMTPKWNFFLSADWGNSSVWLPQLGLFLIPVVAAILTYYSSKISMTMNPQSAGAGQMKSMTIMMPVMTLWFAFIMPAALGIYWLISTAFSIVQDVVLTVRYKKVMERDDAIRIAAQKEREAEMEAKRQETERRRAENTTVTNPNTSKKKQQKQEKLGQAARAAEWEKKKEPNLQVTGDPSRPYARGRGFNPDRRERELQSTLSKKAADEEEMLERLSEEEEKKTASYVPAADFDTEDIETRDFETEDYEDDEDDEDEYVPEEDKD